MNGDTDNRVIAAMERIGMVLGALYATHLGDLDQKLKADRLSRCGFSNTEIAHLLATTPNTINVALHSVRRKKKRTGKGRSRKAK